MTATVTPATHVTVPSTTTTATEPATSTPSWRTGLRAGVIAGVAAMAVAGIAQGAGVSLEADGEPIPVLAFGELTLFFTVVGVLIARALGRWARQPRSTFVRTTVVLTALSLVPDLAVPADTATKVTLMLTHVVAAAIVIPALSARLAERRCH